MASITNTHSTPIALSDGTPLPPGVATNVANWDDLKGNAVHKAWEKAGVLKVDAKAVPAADEKEHLRARLDELGVDYDKRAGVEKLRATLAEAEQGGGAPSDEG